MPRAATIRSLADIAEDQWGLFTRRQAEATGMAWTTLARMAKNGVVERVAHGVYRLRGTPPVEHLALRVTALVDLAQRGSLKVLTLAWDVNGS